MSFCSVFAFIAFQDYNLRHLLGIVPSPLDSEVRMEFWV